MAALGSAPGTLRGLLISGVAVTALALSACGGASHHRVEQSSTHRRMSHARIAGSANDALVGQVDRHASSWVAFNIGESTDPYGDSRLEGFGVATGLTYGRLLNVQDRVRQLAVSQWVGFNRLIVFDRTHTLIFGVAGGRLTRLGSAPFPRPEAAAAAWSPDGKWIATQPSIRVSCGSGAVAGGVCTTPGPTIYVARADGSDRRRVARGQLSGWISDGKLLLFDGHNAEFNAGSFVTLDLRSRRQRTAISSAAVAAYAHARNAELGQLAYSADGRYLAALAVLQGLSRRRNLPLGAERAIVIAQADGAIVKLITRTDIISMFAWSAHGHQLAYTTSGFPVPHELYVLRSPQGKPWRVLSQIDHFDWVTWSPDDRWLLIDNQHLRAWELLRLTGHRQARGFAGASVPTRRLQRLGGAPLWCCPQDHYGGT